MEKPTTTQELTIRDCAFTALATGEEARNLRELRDRIARVPEGSLYYHFWGRLLRPVFDLREYVNDFGNWVGYQLRDFVLAERLALVDPADFSVTEELRDRLLEILEERVADSGWSTEASPGHAFHFLRGKIVVFDTGRSVRRPSDLPEVVRGLSASSVYYHFVDARAQSRDGVDDFQRWLAGFGEEYEPLVSALGTVDLYHTSLAELQEELASRFERFFAKEGQV